MRIRAALRRMVDRASRDPGPDTTAIEPIDFHTILDRDQPKDEQLARLGTIAWTLILLEHTWVTRRVDSVSPVGERAFRRRMSVDFRFPEDSAAHARRFGFSNFPVPLTILRKRPLSSFDLRDEGGRSLPLLSTGQNGLVGQAVLRAGFEQMAVPINDKMGDKLRLLATERPSDAVHAARDALLALLPSAAGLDKTGLLKQSFMEQLISTLADSFLLLVDLPLEDLRRRRVLKFAYEQPVEPTAALQGESGQVAIPSHPVSRAVGWEPIDLSFRLPSLLWTATYHFEMAAPPGLSLVEGRLYLDDPTKPKVVPHVPVRCMQPGALVHLACPRPMTAPAPQVVVRLRPDPGGPVGAAWLLALASVPLLVAAAFVSGHSVASMGHSPLPTVILTTSGSPITLLLLLPGVAAALLGRQGEHVLASGRLRGIRGLSAVTAVELFVAAGLLAFGAAPRVTRVLDLVMAVLAFEAASALWVTHVLSSGERGERPRRRLLVAAVISWASAVAVIALLAAGIQVATVVDAGLRVCLRAGRRIFSILHARMVRWSALVVMVGVGAFLARDQFKPSGVVSDGWVVACVIVVLVAFAFGLAGALSYLSAHTIPAKPDKNAAWLINRTQRVWRWGVAPLKTARALS